MKKYHWLAICMVLCFVSTTFSETVREKELERIKINEKFDKLKLREEKDFVIDRSEDFLKVPKKKPEGDYDVAQIPPTIKLRIVPDMVPEYFTDLIDNSEAYMICWANWARVTRSEDNRFFFSVGDHRGTGCHLNIYEYCPGRNLVHKVVDVGKVLGWTEHSYTDGKIHGHMGIMPDGTLWAATHYGVYPDSSWWANGYRGSWLLSYNIYTHEAKNWGVPLIGNMLPDFTLDAKRGRLVGTGSNYTMLCWDCINKKVRYAGYPPNGWIWRTRAMLCDEETGKFWSSDISDKQYRFLSFDPEINKFERYELSLPVNPDTDKLGTLRGWTDRPAMDGYFYCYGNNGMIFKFKPEGESGPEVEPVCVSWRKGMDVLQMVLSPNGRYVYYCPRYTSPLIQYDVKTGKRKVICFISDYYFDKYGYSIGGSYGMEISKDGSFVVICMNGSFQGK